MRAAIEFERVQRRYGSMEVLAGLSLTVGRGEVYALLGRNGAGKTTALRIALGLLQPHAGSVRVLGVDAAALPAELRDRIGVVSEGHRLPPWRSVRTTLAFEAATRRRFDALYVRRQIERSRLPLDQRVGALSAGQQAALSVVLALAGRPEVVVFDDPGVGLDPVTRRDALETIIGLLADAGTTVLYTSHDLAQVERLADRVGILDRGRLVVDATVDDLRRRVQHRFLRGDRAELALRDPALVDVRRRTGGHELTLVDPSPDLLAALQHEGELEAPRPATVESAFVALTRNDPGLAPDLPAPEGATS